MERTMILQSNNVFFSHAVFIIELWGRGGACRRGFAVFLDSHKLFYLLK